MAELKLGLEAKTFMLNSNIKTREIIFLILFVLLPLLIINLGYYTKNDQNGK